MPFIGVRQLCRENAKIFADLEKTGEPVVIARHGKPIAALIRVQESQLNDLVLAAAPEFTQSISEADEDLVAGRAEPLGAVLAELADAEPDAEAMLGELAGATVGAGPYGDLIGAISRDIVESAPIELEADDAIGLRELNEDLLRTAFTAELRLAFASALDRVRALNANAASVSVADLTAQQYRMLLQNASVVEHLSSGRAIFSGPGAGESLIARVAALPATDTYTGKAKARSAPRRRAAKR
jgi:antitoxin (DNA-binding transcriptional repressor) of toxin-antitoxin stability system